MKLKINYDCMLNYCAQALTLTLMKHAGEKHNAKSLRMYEAGFHEGWKQALDAVRQEVEGR